jgi:hypothetical protein
MSGYVMSKLPGVALRQQENLLIPQPLITRRTFVFADTFLALERAHLLRLAAWGAVCLLLGTALAATVLARRVDSPLLKHFAIQTAAWGAVDLGVAAWGWRGLRLRDHVAAASLERLVWLNLGLDAGYVAVGVVLALTGWLVGRRLAPVGAGLGVVMQGVALLALHGSFAARITPMG